jgi:hypothetical protein
MDDAISVNTLPENQALAAPPYLLFDYRAVAVATLLGGPLGGCTLMALNYRRLRDSGAAITSALAGIVITSLLVLLGYVVDARPAQALGLIALIGMSRIAKHLQGDDIAEHLRNCGRLASRWTAAGIGLACLALVALVVFAIVLPGASKTKVTFGDDEVYYSGSATEQNARAFGEALKTAGYFQGKGFSAELLKDSDGTTLSFVVKDGAWDDAEKVKLFEDIARQIAPAVGGLPLQLRFLNANSETKKEIKVE